MKNRVTYLFFLLIIISFSCNKDNDCDGTVSLERILPSSNPPGTEVRIVGTGFSANPQIRFGGQLAKSSFTTEKGLTAIVPRNITGLVDLTVEDGDCLVRTEFEALGTLPNNWVAAPTVIVVPVPPFNFPTNISNQWKNLYDPDHSFILVADGCPFYSSEEKALNFSFENHNTNKFLQNNPITGIFECNDKLDITVDRTQKGGTLERYFGYVTTAETVGESSSDGLTYMVLVSQTGRQYVFWTKI